jgi:hypothetical protein
MMRKIIFLIALYFTNTYVSAQQLSIYPATLRYSVNNTGSSETQTINITNKSDKNQAVEIYLGDWTRNEDGSHSYFDPGSQTYSCANWVELNTKFLNIPPNGTAQVIVTLRVPNSPESIEAMKWAMLYIQGSEFRDKLDEGSSKLNTRVNEVLRFGVHIYQTPSGLNLLEAKAVTLVQNQEEVNVFDFKIENSGGVMIKTKSHLELTNISTGQEFKSDVEECPIFPLGKRVVSLHLPEGIPKGQYSMLGILDYGNPNSLEAIEQIVEIK